MPTLIYISTLHIVHTTKHLGQKRTDGQTNRKNPRHRNHDLDGSQEEDKETEESHGRHYNLPGATVLLTFRPKETVARETERRIRGDLRSAWGGPGEARGVWATVSWRRNAARCCRSKMVVGITVATRTVIHMSTRTTKSTTAKSATAVQSHVRGLVRTNGGGGGGKCFKVSWWAVSRVGAVVGKVKQSVRCVCIHVLYV